MEVREKRLLYMDNLRLLMIIFVVIQHLAVTYSGFGSWYFKEGKPIGLISTIIFGFYQSFTQGYFMGLLFLIAGYFVPGAYDKKGFGKFLKDRFIRLGIPVLIYMLVINPFILYVELGLYWVRPKPGFVSFYLRYLGNFSFINGSGPMWFALALLIFTVIYGLIRLIKPRNIEAPRKNIELGFHNIWILIFLIAVWAFLIRTVQPIGTSVLNMQLCYFSQYIILFIVGIYAYRNNLFSKIDYKSGKKWLMFGILGGFISWLILLLAGGALKGMTAFNGGWTWQSAGYAIWESFIAVATDVGLLALFREKYNRQGRLIKILSDSSFAVYVFHPPIIIAAAILFSTIQLIPIIKFIILCIVCVPICFTVAHFIVRRIPLLKSVM